MENLLQLSAAVVFMALYAFYYLNKQPEYLLELPSEIQPSKPKKSKKSQKNPKKSQEKNLQRKSSTEKIEKVDEKIVQQVQSEIIEQEPKEVQKTEKKEQNQTNIKTIVKNIQLQLAILPEKNTVILEQLKLASAADYKDASKAKKSLENALDRSHAESSKLSNELVNTRKNLTIAQKEVQEHNQRAKFIEDRARQEIAKELEKLKLENSSLKSENSKLAKTQNTHDARNAELELLAKRRLDQINILQNISKSTAISNRLAQLNEESSKKVPELEAEISQLNIQLQKVTDDAEKSNSNSRKLQKNLDEANKKIKTKNSEINRLSKKNEDNDQSKKITEMEDSIEGLNKIIQEYQKNADLLKEAKIEVEKKNSVMKLNCEKFEAKIKELEESSAELPALLKDVCSLQQEKNDLKNKVEELQQISGKASEMEKILNDTDKQLAEANQEVATYKGELSLLRTKLEAWEVDFENIKSEKAQLETQVSEQNAAAANSGPSFNISAFNSSAGITWQPDESSSLESQLGQKFKSSVKDAEIAITSGKDAAFKKEIETIRQSFETKSQISEDKLINVRSETAKIEKVMLDYKAKFERVNCATLSATERLTQIENEFQQEREQWLNKIEQAQLEKQQDVSKYTNLLSTVEEKLAAAQESFDSELRKKESKSLEQAELISEQRTTISQLEKNSIKVNGTGDIGINGSQKSEEDWVKLDDAVSAE